MARNDIRGGGADALGRLLAKNSTLRILHCSENEFGNHGMKNFCEGLKVNSTLEELKIGPNDYNDGGMNSLTRALQENADSAIKTLWLGEAESLDAEQMHLTFNVIGGRAEEEDKPEQEEESEP